MCAARRTRRLCRLAALVLTCACAAPKIEGSKPEGPPIAVQGRLVADAVWRGTVVLADDFQVPRGRTLRILAGTRVLVQPADTTKTEPEYLDNATEFLVRGRLLVEGTAERPVVFEPLPAAAGGDAGPRWGGIIFDGGAGEIRHARLTGAETGLTLLASSPRVADLSIAGVRQGIAIHFGSAPRLLRVAVDAEDVGVNCWPGSTPFLEAVKVRAGEHEGLLVAPGAAPRVNGSSFSGRLGDVLWGAPADPPPAIAGSRVRRVPDTGGYRGFAPKLPFEPRVPPPGATPTRVYRGENFIGEDTTWEGEVLIDGTVMVAAIAHLTVAPGTVVRFAFRDADGDGVGESEIFVQGRLDAEGTREEPITFTAYDGAGPGRWGAINLMGSDAEESHLAWVLVESSFRGLHGHFSRFRAEHSIFRDNYRSIQFQESAAAIADCAVTRSASALRFRDSTAALEGLAVFSNALGIQILRSSFSLVGSAITGNSLAGVHARESEGTISGSRFEANAPGLRASDCRLRLEGSRFTANNGAGLQLRRTEGRVEGNRVEANVGNGISTDSPGAVLRGNSIEGNLRFALESNTAAAIDAAENWWGPGGPIPDVIFDREDDPALGLVVTAPPLVAPPVLDSPAR
jgi:hypothetical protein